jgi:hypothetical protein
VMWRWWKWCGMATRISKVVDWIWSCWDGFEVDFIWQVQVVFNRPHFRHSHHQRTLPFHQTPFQTLERFIWFTYFLLPPTAKRKGEKRRWKSAPMMNENGKKKKENSVGERGQ